MASLLVLAAGMGSRYGGLKQIDPVGPSGETLLDYAVFDALRAGFDQVVFVIRREFEADFRSRVIARYGEKVATVVVWQELGDIPPGFALPPGREKPWGTAHAVWAARRVLRSNFAVVNADDFYGLDALRSLAEFLGRQNPAQARFALVGFRLANTLSEGGTVTRGLATVQAGHLVSLAETAGIAAADVGPGRAFSGEEVVSMNCWGFTLALFPLLEVALRHFFVSHGFDLKAEFFLPTAVSAAVKAGQARVEVLPGAGEWFGVTHRADHPRVAAAMAGLVARGAYPARLFP